MNYTGQFKNINDTLYQIDVDINNGITGSTEIVLSGDPFRVEYNSGNTIFEPLKLSNATCTIISNQYNFDLYSATAQGSKLTLTNVDTNTIEWVGYITPNIYTQGFENVYEEIQLEAIDGLSTLDNYKYTQIDIDNRKIKSFQDILLHIISKCNCYTSISVNENNVLLNQIDNNILNKLFISEQNFFNEDGTALTYKEVLTEILQFLGYTITTSGTSIFILDYDYLKAGLTSYTTFSTSNNWLTFTTSGTTLNSTHNITSNSFKSNGATIELDSVYNQCSIKTSEYKNDSLLPEFFKDDYLTNILTTGTGDWNDNTTLAFGANTYIFKYYRNKNYTNILYNNDLSWQQFTQNSMSYAGTTGIIGSSFVRMASYKTSDGIPATLSFSEYILLHRHLLADNPNHNYDQRNTYKQVLKLNAGSVSESSYMYDNYYLVLNTEMLIDDRINIAYIDDSLTKSGDDSGWFETQMWLLSKLKIGDKYWNGTIWTTTDSTFKIRFSKGSEKHLLYKWFKVKNTVSFNDFIGESGQKIPITKNDKLSGAVEFYLYTPTAILPQFNVECVWLKDLTLKLIKQDKNKNDNSDTEYKNIINTEYVNEFTDLNFKVVSDTNKGLNYSVVIDKPTDLIGYENNQKIWNIALSINQKQEYNIIQKYVRQYSTPKKILNITLGNEFKPYSIFTCDLFYNQKFIISKMSIDYYNNNNLLTIVEKV